MSERTMLIDSSGKRYLFDAVFSSSHTLNVKITEHPVQSGAAIADHAFIEPDTVSLEIGMSDAMTSADTIAGDNQNRSVSAYRALREFALSRTPLTLVTRLNTYENMLIETIAAEESLEAMNALRAEVTFKKLNMVQIAEVSIQQTASSSKISYDDNEDVTVNESGIPIDLILANQQITGTTNSGTVSAKKSKYPVITMIDQKGNETFVANKDTMFYAPEDANPEAYIEHRKNLSAAVKAYEAIMGLGESNGRPQIIVDGEDMFAKYY